MSARANITISGRQLLVDGAPFHIKGVCWNPVGKGGTHPESVDFRGFVDSDSELMKEAGINVVRTYDPIYDTSVLDTFLSKGIRVAMNVYPWGGAAPSQAKQAVEQLKDHPAILMWEVGNEWNYNGLYVQMPFEEARDRVAEVVNLVKQADTSRPVVSVYGEIPSAETINMLHEVDMWAINVYRGIDFRNLFDQFAAVSDKPMYLGEYGADAWNALIDANDNASQAEATRVLTQQIIDNAAVTGGVCSGGAIFEFADEWWKDGSGSPAVHDVGGVAPGGGPHPDLTFNEEWWGILDVDRNPREAYRVYKSMPIPR